MKIDETNRGIYNRKCGVKNMQGITKAEWQGIVQKLAKGALPVPEAFISDYDNWLCRSYAGRALYANGDIENALLVLATVLDVHPDLQDKPAEGFSQTEHKVLCLLDMAEIIWSLTKNGEAALCYLDEAYELCKQYTGEFLVTDEYRCNVRRWEIMSEMGKDGAVEELQKANLLVKPKKEQEKLSIYEVRHRKYSDKFKM